MAKKKQRVVQHIMEDESREVFRSLIPKEWVIHDYKPDYGVDNVVEIFKYIDKKKEKAETLGELFFVQLKSVKKTKIKKLKVYPRYNVEKKPLLKSQDRKETPKTIDVIKFQLDTSELLTIQSMGAGIPVLLVLVALDTQKAYHVCLNDYIDKIMIPHDNNYVDKKFKTINVPVKNEIKNDHDHLVPLRFYAKRSKLYAAFIKFEYQANELGYILPFNSVELSDEVKSTLLHFIAILKRYDFWRNCEMWRVVESYYDELCELEKVLNNMSNRTINAYLKKTMGYNKATDIDAIDAIFYMKISSLWDRLKVLSRMYEEICREWFLPTYLAEELS